MLYFRNILGVYICLILIFSALGNPLSAQSIIADHSVISQYELIPDTIIQSISGNFRFNYGHTSHGSQIITGLSMIQIEVPSMDAPYFGEFSDDLGTLGDTSWAATFRNRFNIGDYNMGMMSWCGGVSTNTPAGIATYLAKMSEFESAFPEVTFIYMTGHLDGTGTDGNLYAMNDLIRDCCLQNGKILFDFADIESYDPEGTYYPDESDACEWCEDWCATHSCPSCGGCAHSHCFNCYQKGKAFWWLMARVAGWNADIDPPGCGDVTGDGLINVLDVIFLVNYKFKGGAAPDPLSAADVDMNQDVNILDIILLVNYKFKDGPAPACLK